MSHDIEDARNGELNRPNRHPNLTVLGPCSGAESANIDAHVCVLKLCCISVLPQISGIHVLGDVNQGGFSCNFANGSIP